MKTHITPQEKTQTLLNQGLTINQIIELSKEMMQTKCPNSWELWHGLYMHVKNLK